MVVCQGDVFWANLYPSRGSEPKDKRPVVVVQRDSINRSKFQTVVVVPFTKQIKHADIRGNVLLSKGEANIPRESLARGTHVMVLDKSRLVEKAGTLTQEKRQDILNHLIWVLGQDKLSASVRVSPR